MSEDLTGRHLGGFRLTELLGAGAHGSVWRARQVRLDRDVAVKILDPVVSRNPDAARRFEREGRSAASLDHPNVVPVYEAGEQDGLVYLAMRLVDGETLEQRLDTSGPLSVADTTATLRPVAAALDHAHARGLVHRDVKPSNILLDDTSAAAGVWLADFGIAASVREMGTYTTGVLGTAEYMAPEQANAGDVDHRADLYGLGCVAFHALVGHPPFPGDDLITTLMAHVNEPLPSTGVPQQDAFFARALAKDPDDRFDSGAELIGALAALEEPAAAEAASTAATATSSGTTPPAKRSGSVLPWALAVSAIAIVAVVALLLSRGDDPVTADAAEDSPVATEQPAATEAVPGPTTSPPVDTDDSGNSGAIPLALTSGGTVEVGTTRSLRSINPHVDRFVEPFMTGHVLPPLMMIDSDWSFTPWLAADEPEVVSNNPLTVRWTLRSDAVWNDGTAVTSRDVSRTLDYLLDPDSGATGTLLYQGASISIIDETTFDIVFDSPIGAHRVLFSTIHPVIKAAAYDAHLAGGETAATFMIDGVAFSAGPYQVGGFDSEERLTFVRNDRWWGEAALLDRITVRTYDSARDQLDALEIGELDLVHVEDARATDAARARGFDDVIVDVGVGDQFLRLEMNTRKGPLAEISVRLAIASVIDRELIAEAAVTPITGEVTARADSLIWAGSQAENEHPFARFDGDAEAAAALLQEAGWELDVQGARFRNGEVLEIRLIYAENSSLAEQTLVQAVVVQLLDVGVRVVASVEGSDELFNSRVTGNYDLVLALDVVNTDPVAALFRFGSQYCPTTFGSPGCDSSIGTNLTGIADPALDALLASSSVEADPAARRAIFVEIDQMLSELAPALPLYELPTFAAHAQRLGGVLVNTHRGGPFSDMATWGFAAEVDPE